jgi:hypothetical protein
MATPRTTLALALLLPLAATAQLTCADAVVVGIGTHTAPPVTGAAPVANCGGVFNLGTHGLWYRFTPTANMVLTVSSYNIGLPAVDTRLHVYTGTCDALVCYSGGDDEGPGYTSIATFNATGGTTYTLAWDNFWSGDAFTFSVLESWVPENVVLFANNPIAGLERCARCGGHEQRWAGRPGGTRRARLQRGLPDRGRGVRRHQLPHQHRPPTVRRGASPWAIGTATATATCCMVVATVPPS